MSLRTILLGAVAAAFAAGPVLAQSDLSSHYYDTHSTPQERAQTEMLNRDAQGGSVPPAVQSTYQQQLEEYQQQKQEYRRQRAHYEMQRDRYEAQRDRYSAQRAAFYAEISGDPWAVPAVAPPAYPDEAGLIAIHAIAAPETELERAPLVDGEGHWVGRVRTVETAYDGRARRIGIYLYRDHRTVWLHPRELRYDSGDGVLFTLLDYNDLRQMPGRSS
jgi:hypothetical protein